MVPMSGGDFPQGSSAWMLPRTIKFTQSSISRVFSRRKASASSSSYADAVKVLESDAGAQTLDNLVEQLKKGEVHVTDIPPIRVYYHEGIPYSLDNRRLWVFRHFEERIPVELVEDCAKEFFQKWDPESSGDFASVTFIGSGSQGKDKFHEVSMVHHVLSWSVNNILEERLHVNKADPLPLSFSSRKQYLRGFRWPLLEETRATILHKLEEIDGTPRLQVTLHECPKSNDPPKFKSFEIQVSVGGTCQPRTKDLFLFSTALPNCVGELQRQGTYYTMGYITKALRSEDNVSMTGLLYVPNRSQEYYATHDAGRTWHAIYITNLATKLRIWDALESFSSSDARVPLLEEILEPALGSQVPKSTNDSSLEILQAVKKYCKDVRALNASQTEAVVHVISGLVNKEWPRIRLIQGPPGTGKTSLLLSLLCILGSMTYRVHMCAPTNTAICEVASRFVAQMLVDSMSKQCLDSAQFGAWFSGLDGGKVNRMLHLGDVVLVGNEEKINFVEDHLLESIYLPCRVKRLMAALSSITGYRSSVQALIHFLRCALAEFEIHEQCSQLYGSSKKPESLSTFVTEKLKLLGPAMIKNCDILCQDLPSQILKCGTMVQVHNASNLVKQILEYLMSNKISDDQVRFWLSSAADEPGLTNCPERWRSAKLEHFLEAKSQLLEILETCPGFDVLAGKVHSEAELERICLKHTVVLFSTVGTGGRNSIAKSGLFDCVVIDEASQLVEVETLVVLQSQNLQQLVLVGDHKQLPATVISKVAKDWEYGRSLFKRLHMLDHPYRLLDVQYRMHPEISIFPNNQFYSGQLKDGPNVLTREYSTKPFQCTRLKAYSFLDIRDGSEHKDIGGTSWMNPVEVRVVMHLISVLNKVCAEKDIVLTVGVVAPYSGQVQALTKQIDASGGKFPKLMVEVQSVDGLQGREKDVVIFSAVRSNSAGNIGFLSAYERLNVAITRGRYCVWILGNAGTLSRDDVWRSLIENAKQRKCFIQPDNDMLQVIKKAKISLNEFAEILKPTSAVFNHTIWKVSFSIELRKTVQAIKSKLARHALLARMLRLAQGHHATRYQREMTSPCSRIARVHYAANLYLVWSVDLEFAPEVKQVLKFWDAVDEARLPSLLRRLEAGFAIYTDAYVNRCLIKQEVKRGTIVTPKIWERDEGFIRYKSLDHDGLQSDGAVQDVLLEKSCVDESILQMKFFALNSGIAHQLITAADGSSFELPFVVNDDEARIIDYPGSSFIIGRSGTGKTTVLTTKLLQRQQQFSLAEEGFHDIEKLDEAKESKRPRADKENRALRQALVTRSPKLCAAIKNHINKIQRALEAAAKGATLDNSLEAEDELKLYQDEEEKLLGSIPNSFADVPAESFPLVITFSKLLYMIEGCLVNKFFTPDEHAWRESMGDTGLDNLVSSLSLSPNQVQESTIGTDTHDVNKLLEKHGSQRIGHYDGEKGYPEVEIQQGGMKLLVRKDRPRLEVDFIRFCSVYWTHFNQDLKSKLDPSLLYGEIMSCIKGSLAALRSPKKCMERHDYVSLAGTKTSTLGEGLREEIYSLYLQYENLKRLWNDYDLADYVMHLHRELETGACQGHYLDYVYVDEVQDLTPAQIALFKYLCRNVQEGFMFAGDTAQTIAKGVGFRFEDIRNLFYIEFLGKSMSGAGRASQSQAMSKSRSEPSIPVPDLHFLTRNFRTHMGILKMANSVVQLICRFFPYAIDKLNPETSLLHGEAPLFLEIEENHDLVTALFNRGEMGGGGCEFGAEQAILVRDETSKHAMLRSLEAMKKTCLVLTVDECKGLEFQDVLLYNFFADSVCGRKWRVLYASLKDGDFLSAEEKQHLAPSRFEFIKHSALCTELKQLYVAVTRARQRLWIYDNDVNSHKPILDYWRAAKLVQVQFLDDSLAEDLKRKSSPDDWKRRGVKLFQERQFSNAKLCFDKAGDLVNSRLAEAEECLQAANRPVVDSHKVQSFRQTALDIFLDVKNIDKALKCCKMLNDHKQAGAILETIGKFEDAGGFYSEGKHFLEAATAYHKGACYEQCLGICLQSKTFDAGLAYISQWENAVDRENLEHAVSSLESIKVAYLQKCADYYKNLGKTQEMMKYVKFLPTMDLKRLILRETHLEELLELEEAAGSFIEAEKIAEELGCWEHSAVLSVKAGNAQRGVDKLLHLAQLQIFWGNSDGKVLIEKVEAIISSHPEIYSVSKLEMDILKTCRNGNRGHWLASWNELRSLRALRLEIIAGKSVICDILDDMLARPGCFTSKSSELWNLPTLTTYEAAIEGMQILVVCKRLWVIWSKCVHSILEGLESLSSKENMCVADVHSLQSCLEFLGVRQRASGAFYLEYPKASWLKGQRPDRNGEISKKDLTTLALQYWKDELLQVTRRISNEIKELRLRHYSSSGDPRLDLDIHFEIGIEMVEIFQVLEKMNFRNVVLSGQTYLQWSSKVEGMLFDYAGLVYGSPRSEVVVQVLDSIAMKSWRERRLASALLLYPYISRQCIDKMMSDPSKSGVPQAMLQSWRLFYHESLGAEPPLPCESLVSILKTSFQYHVDIPAASVCSWAERVAVSLCSVYTHLRGFIIPVKLAYSCMAGPNQERFYSEAARVPCRSSHQSMIPLFEHVIGQILEFIQEFDGVHWAREYNIRLIKVLLILLINLNLNDQMFRGKKLAAVQKVFMASYRMWNLPARFETELVNVLRRQHVKIAQVGQAFARAIGDMDPLIVLKTEGVGFEMPAWVQRELPTVIMENDSSGKPVFSGRGTVIGFKPSYAGRLSHSLLGSLEAGDLSPLSSIFSKEPPSQTNLTSANPVDDDSTREIVTNSEGEVGKQGGTHSRSQIPEIPAGQTKNSGKGQGSAISENLSKSSKAKPKKKGGKAKKKKTR